VTQAESGEKQGGSEEHLHESDAEATKCRILRLASQDLAEFSNRRLYGSKKSIKGKENSKSEESASR